MTDLKSDIEGQVARLPLKPSEATSLLPMFEAVSNSLFALYERFDDKGMVENGRIEITVHRNELEDNAPVIGFDILDNGIGLNQQNYNSFCTPFSRHKLDRGGKGVGRLGWLKVFEKISIDSAYKDPEGKIAKRAFDFVLRKNNQVSDKECLRDFDDLTGTFVSLRDFIGAFSSYCPVKAETIIQRTIAHFLPVFAAENSPKITITDGETTDLREKFESYTVKSKEELMDVEIEGEVQPILLRHMQCSKDIRPRGTKKNWMCFCANDRGVNEFAIDDMIGLGMLDGDQIYIGAVTGDYLDTHVNPQRTGFIFESDDGKSIRQQAVASSKKFLAEYLELEIKKKKEIAQKVIKKNPQFLYLSSEIEEFVRGLEPSCQSEEQIFMAMALSRSRRQRKFARVEQDIATATVYDQQIQQKVEDYKQFIVDDNKGSLAEYVAKRKSILDLLDKLVGIDEETGSDHLEEAVHNLICPMRVTSQMIDIEDHNLWILDDRLAFSNFFASDKALTSYTEATSTREPDIALLYDSCLAWREKENSSDTVILVEFKRPNKPSYTDKTDPFMQVLDYVELFQSGKSIRDKDGKTISNVGRNTAFHCYIVADLTDGLKRRLRGQLEHTPDQMGMFGYTRNPDAYIEVIPYQKLILDAHARNAVFFKKLGIEN